MIWAGSILLLVLVPFLSSKTHDLRTSARWNLARPTFRAGRVPHPKINASDKARAKWSHSACPHRPGVCRCRGPEGHILEVAVA